MLERERKNEEKGKVTVNQERGAGNLDVSDTGGISFDVRGSSSNPSFNSSSQLVNPAGLSGPSSAGSRHVSGYPPS
jgi:hypothetical protein